MKKWFREHKSEIIVGVIVFFITSLFTIVGKWLIFAIPPASSSFLSFLRNLIFIIAAQHNGHKVSEYFVFGIIICFSILTARIAVKGFRLTNKVSSYEKIEQKLDELTQLSKEDLKKKKEELDSIKQQVNKAKKKLAKKEHQPTTKTTRIMFALILCFLIIYIAGLFMYGMLPVALWNTFDISITQIAPYVEEQQIKVLRSQWTQMRSYEDFKQIDNFILNVKQENGLS